MEQYVHTLIATNPVYFPTPSQVVEFFSDVLTSSGFCGANDKSPKPLLWVMKHLGRSRFAVNVFTGEKKSFEVPDRIEVEEPAAIPEQINELNRYSVRASGKWQFENRPLELLISDGTAFIQDYLCDISCHLRAEPVSLSCKLNDAAPFNNEEPIFGLPCKGEDGDGVFSNPWTGEMIRVPNAACSRFWIELEFGKFLLPRMASSFNLLEESLVAQTERCFNTNFAQGWTYR